jgi:hypothetical protein
MWEEQGLLIHLSGGLRNRIPEFIPRKGQLFLAYFPNLKYKGRIMQYMCWLYVCMYTPPPFQLLNV